ncbi:uncharacterized protein LOC116020319 [Ipomoea triloba]|uniref:uncharacterized protein LOC116020319 n=1 Tax=Ipomoea triloba TaxID=35885 RepID=UPI00125DAA19|nr:uncharacterized protein LOC116020319 [Ipomoea triloba]
MNPFYTIILFYFLGTYLDFGDQIYACDHCGALFWLEERINKVMGNQNPKYSLCCTHGKIKLPPPSTPPTSIFGLFFNNDVKSTHFLQNIRSYNNMFCFTSMGGKIDRTINNGNSPPVFRLHGQNFHLMGSLLPELRAQDDSTNRLHVDIVQDIKDALDHNNVLVKTFRMARSEIETNPMTEIKIKLIGKRTKDARTYNLPQVGEVAALIVGDIDPNMGQRDILVESKAGHFQRISELNPAYLPLQYPLLFPYGEDGYREDIQFAEVDGRSAARRNRISPREYFSFRLQDKVYEMSTLLYARRLFQQFLVDAYTMIESGRLVYIRTHQKSLRCESYKCLTDALTRGEVDPTAQGKRIILPSSFTGGARYMVQNYQDAMAICRWIGYPSLFIMAICRWIGFLLTCNPKWPEIERFLQARRLKAEDRPDIICRVFKMKLNALIKELRKDNIFGSVLAVIYTIEFQKRGLPHAHILLFLAKSHSASTPRDIDMMISAEVPSDLCDPEYYKAVEEFMMHGPCGSARKSSPCMVNGRCSKFYPKKFVEKSTLDEDGYPIYRRSDNGRTITKNGIELDSRYVVPHNRYLLLKYRAHINVEWCNQSRSIKYLFKYVNKGNDRVTAEFYNSAAEKGTGKEIDEIKMYYDCRYISPCEAAWRIFAFDIQFRNPSVERLSFHLPNEQSIIFDDDDVVGDVVNRPTVAHSMFTAWFEVRGPTCFDDIKTVDGVQYNSFRDACYARGLIEDDKEYVDAITEAALWSSSHSLRKLFVTLLTSNSMAKPENVWEVVRQYLSDDAEFNARRKLNIPDLILNEAQKYNFALIEVEKLLNTWNKSLADYPPMPIPNRSNDWFLGNRLLYEEMAYDREALKQEHESLVSKLTDEQLSIYKKVIQDVQSNKGGLFFVYGYGGTGKTFLWRTMSAALRSKGEVVLNVASSGIASLLLPGGRTAHSRFAIPISINEDSTCNIKQGSPLAELIVKAKMIIWDEAPMMHKHCFEALDRTMRDLMRFSHSKSSEMTFGGKTVVLGGDFRQILPVIPKGTRQDIVQASINSSYLWNNCEVLRLTKNLRLRGITIGEEVEKLETFANWIADLGDGKLGQNNDGECNIVIPSQFVLQNEGDPIKEITYLSCDSVCKSDTNANMLSEVHTTEFLNSLRCSGVPNHSLTLKVGSPIMLLRNIDHSLGLCNGTRLIVTKLGNHVIEAQILCGNNAGTNVLIPRLALTPSDPRLPFKFQRKQFPVMLSYAMTINKSQGQTLSHVGLLLKKPVFNHGQLYVAVSRVSNPDGLKVLICGESRGFLNTKQNVVYKEIFNNL